PRASRRTPSGTRAARRRSPTTRTRCWIARRASRLSTFTTTTPFTSLTSAAGSDVISAAITREVVAEELPAVLAWGARHPGWAVDYDEAALRLNVRVPHPVSGTLLVMAVDLDGYRALPPAW